MEVLNVKFRKTDVECLLALYSRTFVWLTAKNYVFGLREIFGGECFVIELFEFLKNRDRQETVDFLSEIGLSEPAFDSATRDFNALIGTKQNVFSVSFCHNRMSGGQPALFI